MPQCPFDGETTLSDIVDDNEAVKALTERIKRFKTILTPDQLVEFNQIDDAFVSIITHTQHETIKKIHCPACTVKACG